MSEQRTLAYNFDRLGWLQETGYLTRRALFLDLNHWIKLSDRQDNVYRELSEALHETVDAGKLICPVSPSLLMEVKKRPRDDRRYRYCRLMDRLSGGLSLRIGPAVFAEEFRARVLGQEIERHVAYSFFLDAMSVSGWSLDFPGPGWLPGLAKQAAATIYDQFTSMSILQAVNIPTEEQRERNIGYLRDGWSKLAQQAGEWRERNEEVSAAEIEDAEFASTVRSWTPQIAHVLMGPGLSMRGLRGLSSMPDDERRSELKDILRSCPTFWCEYKSLAALRSQKKTLKENDLWDMQHIASAAPYVDCLACDGGTRHLCTQLVHMDDKYGTKIVSKPEDVLTWVRNGIS